MNDSRVETTVDWILHEQMLVDHELVAITASSGATQTGSSSMFDKCETKDYLFEGKQRTGRRVGRGEASQNGATPTASWRGRRRIPFRISLTERKLFTSLEATHFIAH